MEIARGCRKAECYFLATIRDGELCPDRVDFGGEVCLSDNIHPIFLAEGACSTATSEGGTWG